MKIEILNYKNLIELNKLQEVTSGRILNSKMTFDPDGLLSNEIFGISKDDRRNTFAYIKLGQPFIHPHIYKQVLTSLYRTATPNIVGGKKRYSVVDGLLQEDPNGWTGLRSLYEHWDEIQWNKHRSSNKINKDLLLKLTRDKVFIDSLVVIPPAYRDVMLAGTVDSSDHVNELNKMYQHIINLVSNLKGGGLFARTQYSSQQTIQDILVNIYIHFKDMIAKKNGLIRRNLMGKSVDYGCRAVISSAQYNFNKLEDSMVDLEHSALPISLCCSNFYPLIEAWLRNFFQREIINDPNMLSFYDSELQREITAPLKDPDIQFSDANIKKMINSYCMNPSSRFTPISIRVDWPTANGVKERSAILKLKGIKLLPNNVRQTFDRPMTLTDVLYMACVDVCEKRHLMISRYPVGTDKGIFFCKIRVQSTNSHCNVILDGKEYKFYPDIDLSTDLHKVEIQFTDTLVMSNSHLDGMGKH